MDLRGRVCTIRAMESPEWLERLDVQRVQVFVHPSAWSWRPPPRSHHNLWIALEGGGEMVLNGRRFPVEAGTAFLVRPDDQVEGTSAPGQRLANFAAHFSVPGQRIGPPFERLEGSEPARLEGATWLPPFCRHLSQLFFADLERHRNELRAGLRFLLHAFHTHMGASGADEADHKIRQLVETIRQDPATHRSVQSMARSAGLSVSQFTRRFRAATGTSPRRFAIEERLARAETYLRESPLTVEAIAQQLGYSEVYFFSRQFRRFRGRTPSSVRSNRK